MLYCMGHARTEQSPQELQMPFSAVVVEPFDNIGAFRI
jgi:hypothetical protein